MVSKNDYLETAGPVLFNCINDIELAQRSFLLQDRTILKCVERVQSLGFLSNVNECQSVTHQFEEITYLSDDLQVKALMMTPLHEVKRIVVYLRGGKGQVGRVRAGRLMQFSDSQTLVIGPYYRGNNGSEGKDEFYRGDLNDVTELLRLLR